MQTKPRQFNIQIRNKTLFYHYYFTTEGTAYKSGLINLVIQADDPGMKTLKGIRITVPNTYADKPDREIELLAKAEVLNFYSK